MRPGIWLSHPRVQPVDSAFAKSDLDLIFHERLSHPSGQLPAYEWSFSDVNPPVHAICFLSNSIGQTRSERP